MLIPRLKYPLSLLPLITLIFSTCHSEILCNHALAGTS